MRDILLVATLVYSAQCRVDSIPDYDPTEKVIDCTDGKAATDICNIMLVVEPLATMTYYDISTSRAQGYRFTFNSTGHLVPLRNPRSDVSKFIPPIQVDGHFRTIIAVNGQMPAPTIIAHYDQTLNITVFNELGNVEGITIHWHGIHQRETPEADGVAYVTQNPILPLHSYTYTFKASPAGTHWYHAHSGEQRTDGLYGAFIVKDTLPGNVYDYDYPEQHTLILMDWQRQTGFDMFHFEETGIGYFTDTAVDDPPYVEFNRFSLTYGPDNVGYTVIPFWSGIINDKGRFYDELGRPNIVNPNCDNLNCFSVSQGGHYRFRLIGAQSFFAFRFSIEGHSLKVVASDGSPINSIEDVDYVIVSPGERYDVIVHANNEPRNFWIWAETLEDEVRSNNLVFYNPISKHRAEAILHYNEYNATDIAEINETKTCTPSSKCKAVNCPYPQYGAIIDCINVEQFESPPSISIPQSIHSPNVTMFYSIGLDGAGNYIDGINFRFPSYPPLTEYADFQNSNDVCPNRGCDRDANTQCVCTQVIDFSHLPRGSVIELVITNRNAASDSTYGSFHPMHLHGHYFYVVAMGYGDYDENGTYGVASDDIECIVTSNDQTCTNLFSTMEEENGGELQQELRWKNMTATDRFNTQNKRLARKDTLTVPFGGYMVIRFIVDNPGWWLFHCHIEPDVASGMAVIIRALPNELTSPNDNNNNTCMPTGSSSSSLSFNMNGFSLLVVGMIIALSLVQMEIYIF